MKKYNFEHIRKKALKAPRVTSLLEHFESIAAGVLQAPKTAIVASPDFLQKDPEYEKYHQIFQRNIGTFYKHGCASIPFLMEENIRVGTALYALAKEKYARSKKPLTFYETSSADGTNARTLAEYSNGLIRTLTDSPNESNRIEFAKQLNHTYSLFHKGPFVDITPEYLSTQYQNTHLSGGFDVIVENTTFQLYGANRNEQIAYVSRVLKNDGLIFFQEKMLYPDTDEYERRENIKDRFFKPTYFTTSEVSEKKRIILSEMEKGQVSLETFSKALKQHFNFAYIIWNSTNFYEIVASNSKLTIDTFLQNLSEPFVPESFACESPMVRPLWQRKTVYKKMRRLICRLICISKSKKH